ncbi:helix-turn-helix domain-containing protein [Altererythrobacter lutimaris]|uniref:Helix-turn-helix domain-containing protein n=1 Tax=Altererythrobacter lutimaris TaxID=2743979 RepID=A0A850HD26_9SPHN|nr:helix-turn-helix domain-containing protein [Altererythrobacter lutimaris]NVE94886.1 helix-turn-helix domain-containing protein [Altererythrobacter lutimaris]
MEKQAHQSKYLKACEAARYLRCSVRTLARHRAAGTGPRFIRQGGQILYSIEALEEWIEINTVNPIMSGLVAS